MKTKSLSILALAILLFALTGCGKAQLQVDNDNLRQQLKQQTDEFSKQISSQQNTNDSLRAENDTLRTELGAAKETIEKMEAELQSAQSEIKAQSTNLKQLNKEALTNQHTIQILERALGQKK